MIKSAAAEREKYSTAEGQYKSIWRARSFQQALWKLKEGAHLAGECGKRGGKKNWKVIRIQVLKHLQGAEKPKKRRSEGDVVRRATAGGW